MTCQEAREILWPPGRPRLVKGAVAAARKHVDVCEGCRSYLSQAPFVLDAYVRAKRATAPASLRERVRATVSTARGERLWYGVSFVRWLVAAGVAGIIAATLIALTITSRSEASVRAEADVFAEDYLRRAVGEDHIVTSDPGAIRAFLQRELGMRLSPLDAEGLTLERAEICLIRGRRGAMVVYKLGESTISHYLMPRDGGGRTRLPEVSSPTDGPGAHMPVVMWATPSVEHVLVGGIEPSELLRLAGGRS
ncbi:MAG: hypothetical protein AB7T31_17970 [Gemmatimonadales bacterium]